MSGNQINAVSLPPTAASSIPGAARKDSPIFAGSEPVSPIKTGNISDVDRPASARIDKQSDSNADSQATNQQIESAVAALSSYASSINRDLNFSVDEDSGKTVIKVIDSESDEVIRQIPNEDVLEMAKRMQEYSDSHDAAPPEGLLLKTQA